MTTPSSIRLDTCTVDLDALRVVRDDGTGSRLTATEGKVLAYLVDNHGRVIPRQELLEQAWGYRSGVKSRTVDTTMGRIRSKIETDPTEPTHLLTVFGVGYRFDVPTLEVPGLHGRSEAMRALEHALADTRQVTVVGTAGVGKTSLVRAWAAKQSAGVVWASVNAERTAEGLASAVAAALDRKLEDPDPVDGAARLLADVRHLVLDGLEAAAPAAPPAIERWLAQVPGLKVVATSQVAPVTDPGSSIRLEPLSTEAGAALFAERAELDDPDDARLRSLAERLGGLPLALELAASWLPSLGLEALERAVATFESSELLQAIRQSWSLLSDTEREVLTALATFEDTFTVQAAQVACDRPVGEELVALDRRSMLRADRGEVRLYDAVRAFVRQKPRATDVDERVASWLSDQAGPRWIPDQTRALERSEGPTAMRLKLRLVMAHAAHGLTARARALSDELVHEADEDLAFQAWIARTQAFQQAADAALAVEAAERASELARTDHERAQAARHLALAHVNGGRPQLALVATEGVVAEDPTLDAAIRSQRATALRMIGRPEQAVAEYTETVRVLSRREQWAELGKVHLNLGSVHMELGRPDQALAHYELAEPLVQEHNPNLRAHYLGNKAESLRVMGRHDEARPVFGQAMDLAANVPLIRAILLIQTSALEMECGHLDRAAGLVARAIAEVGTDQPRYRSFALLHQGGIYQARGWETLAIESYDRAHELLDELGDERHLALLEGRMAALFAPTNRDRARQLIDRARARDVPADPVRDALDLYEACVLVQFGRDPAEALARADQPAPGRVEPTRSAWNPEVRYAAELLRAAT